MPFKIPYIHTGVIPPRLHTSNGVTYIVPGWQEVFEGATMDDVYWCKPLKGAQWVAVHEYKSEKRDKTYNIERKLDQYRCTCTGFNIYRKCKHVAYAKENNL